MPENSRRSAHATIRGYLYQTCLGVLRWLDLQPNEVLVCEGDEDLDRHLLDGKVVNEQVKAYSGRLGLGDQAVLESLFNFLRTYVVLRREEKDRTFIFTTTAEPRQQRKKGLDFDLLEKWREGIRNRKVTSAVRSLLKPKKENSHRKEIEEARAWLDSQPEGWLGFMNAVEWTFRAPDLDDIRRTVQSRLARGEKTRNLDADLFTDRLVVHVLEASSQPDINARNLTSAALSNLIEDDLNRWATSLHSRRIREAFDEAARIQDLLNTGTDKLRDHKPGTLLTAAHEVIPFDEVGRQKELDLLAEWCQEAEPRSVFLLTGEGGSGKTRLMIEWCRRLRHQGWHAGFLRRDRQAIELDPFLKGTAPRLVVVDYAETQMTLVKPLLQKLASAERGVDPKMRVVFLARREGDWWRNLFEMDGEIARLPNRSEVITPLIPSDVEERREVFTEPWRALRLRPIKQYPRNRRFLIFLTKTSSVSCFSTWPLWPPWKESGLGTPPRPSTLPLCMSAVSGSSRWRTSACLVIWRHCWNRRWKSLWRLSRSFRAAPQNRKPRISWFVV